jgi:hypothetical protein
MTEISSIPTYFPKIAKRSEPCRTLFRSGASLRIVYRPSEADVIIRVTSWPSEDLMAVYDEHQVPIGNFLWLVWRAILFSTLKLRWSPNLKSNSKACSSTTKLARAPLFWRKVLFITNNVRAFVFIVVASNVSYLLLRCAAPWILVGLFLRSYLFAVSTPFGARP